MNVIDQAFVKAYSRRAKPQSGESVTEPTTVSETTLVGSQDVSVHPQAADAAVVWIDAVADQYLRRDTPHLTSPAPEGDTPVLRGPRARLTASIKDQAAAVSHQALETTAQSVDLSSLCHIQLAFAAPPDQPGNPAAATGNDPEPIPTPTATSTASPTPLACSAAAPPAVAAADTESPVWKPFTPAWEVDTLEFPSTVKALFTDPALLQSIGLPLDRAVSEGLQTVLITSDRPGAGQTSVATGIALSAAAAGLRVALVDASAATPGRAHSLADTLNLEVPSGWLEAIRDGNSVAEVAIHSIEDQLTVIPQTHCTDGNGPTADEFSDMIQMLREGFDLVVIDGPCCRDRAFQAFTTAGRATDGQTAMQPSPVDAVILVQDMRNANTLLAKQVMRSLKSYGITGLGLVENFS